MRDPAKKPSTAQIVVAAVVGGVIVLVCSIAVLVNALKGEEPGGESIMAEVMCEEFIERELVSPATAEYEHSTVFTDPTYTVTGTVDSENALGAMLRSRYTCVVEPTGGDQWTLVSLDLE